MPLSSLLLGLPIFAVPFATVVGLGLWTRRLQRRMALPGFARWTAYALVTVAGMVIVWVLFGLIHTFVAIAAPGFSATQKQSILANGIAEAMYNGAIGVPLAAVCALWLGFFTWRAPRRP